MPPRRRAANTPSRSPSPAAPAPGEASASSSLLAPPSDAERQRLVLVGAAAFLLASTGVGRYPLAVFPYIYTGLLQHALRGAQERRVWLWVALSTYLALCFGLLEFLPIADAGYLIVTGFLAVFPPLAFIAVSALEAKLFPPDPRTGAVPLESTLVMPTVTCAIDYTWANLVLYGSYGIWPYTQYGLLPVMQIASVFGIYGISFFIAWSASLVAWLLGTEQSARDYRRGMLVLTVLWSSVLLLGGARVSALMPEASTPTLRIHAISPPNTTVVRNDLIRAHLGPTIARQELYGGFSNWQPTAAAATAETGIIEDTAELWEYAASDRAWALGAIRESARAGGADLIMLPELGLSCPSEKEERELVEEVQRIADEEDVIVALAIGVGRLDADIPLFAGLALLLELPGPPYAIHGVEENKIRMILPSSSSSSLSSSSRGSDGGGQQQQQQLLLLREELQGLRLAALHKRAIASGGIDLHRIDDVMESDAPKNALIELLLGEEEEEEATPSTTGSAAAAAAESWQYWKRNMVPVIEAPFTNVAEVYGFKGNATPEVHATRDGCKLGTAM